MEDFKLTKKPDLGIFDQQFPARLKEADIYDPTKFTILTGSDGILDDLFSYHVYTRIKNHWRSDVAPADIQPGMIWSDSDDDKLYHHGNVGGAADEEVLQLTRSSDVSPYFANLYIADFIYHAEDLNTYIQFQTDQITLRAGGVDFLNMVEAATDYLQLLDGKNFIGSNTNAMMTVGLTIDQGGADDEIFALKSSGDVAHGMTTLAETDTFFSIAKRSASAGGVTVMGLSEGLEAMNITGVATTDNTDKGAAAVAPIRLVAGKKTLLTGGAVGADANLVVIRNWATTVWHVDEDGDTWQNGMLTAQGLIVGTPTELTISGGAITVTKGYHTVDGEGDVDDDLVTINGGVDGMVLVLRPVSDARDIQILETGNIKLDGVNWLSATKHYTIILIFDAGLNKWEEISRSYND